MFLACCLFPTCQVRVVSFYVSSSAFSSSCSSPPPASSRWQCSPPDLNCQLTMAVFPTGPQRQALDGSVPHRTSTASARWQCSPPDLNCQNLCQIECQGQCGIQGQKVCQIEGQNDSECMSGRMSGFCQIE